MRFIPHMCTLHTSKQYWFLQHQATGLIGIAACHATELFSVTDLLGMSHRPAIATHNGHPLTTHLTLSPGLTPSAFTLAILHATLNRFPGPDEVPQTSPLIDAAWRAEYLPQSLLESLLPYLFHNCAEFNKCMWTLPQKPIPALAVSNFPASPAPPWPPARSASLFSLLYINKSPERYWRMLLCLYLWHFAC